MPSSDAGAQTAAALRDRLEAARRRLDDVPPVFDLAVDRARVLEVNPPRFAATFRDGSGATATVPVTLDEAFVVRPDCDVCDRPCAHMVAAIDEVLAWLEDPEHPRRAELLAAAGEAPWQRWLGAFDDALGALQVEAERRAGARLWWRVDVEDVRLVPYVARPLADGSLGAPKRLRLPEVPTVVDLSAPDRAALAAARQLAAERKAALRDGTARSLVAEALLSLVGHRRVTVDAPGGSPWSVAAPPVRFSVETVDDHLELDVRAGDVTLGAADFGRGRGARTLLFEDAATRTLTVVRLEPALARLLSDWARRAVPVPVSAQAELMQRLSRVAEHVSVQAGDVVQELTVPPRADLVCLLTPVPKGGLHVEIRIRPLPDGPLFGPATGPEAVLGATPDRQILRTTRDLALELEVARQLMARHDLAPDDPAHPFVAYVQETADALDLVEALWARDDVECQWPTQRWTLTETRVETAQVRLGIRRKRDWLEVYGSAHVDDRRLELAVLVQAARRDRGWVAMDDGRFVRLSAALQARLSELDPFTEPRKRALRVSLAAVDRVKALADETYDVEADEAWATLLHRLDEAAALEPEVPAEMQGILRPYQREGFVWMARLAAWGAGAVLADDMGLGKTLQGIAMLLDRAAQGPQLVVAPTSVGFNWARELARFAPSLEVRAYRGPNRERHLEGLGPNVVLVTSYGVVHRDVLVLKRYAWASLVLDEAQAIKNPQAQRAKAIRALDAGWACALTGTPVENHPSEIWSLFSAVFPGLLGTWDSFRVRFLAAAEAEGHAFGSGALAHVIKPYVLRRTKAQVAPELPPKTEIVVDVALSNRERALYDDARLAAIAEMKNTDAVEDTRYHLKVLAALTRLRQLACHPRLVDPKSKVPSSKHERFFQIVHDLRAEGRRALVFSQFVQHLALIRAGLEARGMAYLYLDGSTPAAQRGALVDRFQAGEGDLFLVSTKAGGTGLNLTAADTVLHLDPWWNPAVEDQATDRAHRLGQDQPVTVMRLVARDTVEAQMLDLHADKRDMVADLLEGTEAVGKLSSADLMALIRR